ncbi:MAG: hypothetical protein ACM3Q1_06265 [Bacteroidales bacterium]
MPLCAEDRDYLLRHLRAVGEAFGVNAVPDVPLRVMPARALARHLARLRSTIQAECFEQELALGRLESVYRLLASATRLGAGRLDRARF